MAEREGFEPPVGCPTTVFKTAALSHSAISPRTFSLTQDHERKYNGGGAIMQDFFCEREQKPFPAGKGFSDGPIFVCEPFFLRNSSLYQDIYRAAKLGMW